MKTWIFLSAAALLGISTMNASMAHAGEDPILLKKLAEAKISLIDAINFAESKSGVATSAKFEMDGDQLVFSVYTVPEGLGAPPETATLTEVSGLATTPRINGKAEVFTDKEHIARASVHLTLAQLSRVSLRRAIGLANRAVAGFVYSVKNPKVRGHRAVADVYILTPSGQASVVTIDLEEGRAYLNR